MRAKNRASRNPPEFMRGDERKGTESIGPDDIIWTGEHGEISDEKVDTIARTTLKRAAAKKIVREIIKANSTSDGPKPNGRLERALAALIGPDPLEIEKSTPPDNGKKRRPGRPEDAADDRALEFLAHEYLADICKPASQRRSLNRLCERVTAEMFPNACVGQNQNDVRRLKAKFRDQKDRLLIMVSYHDPDRRAYLQTCVERALAGLFEVGVI